AEVFPVDAHNTARWPRANASVTAIVMPRSLKEPVGLRPSTLRWTVQPVLSEIWVAAISGVPPSSRVTGVQSSPTGNRSRYAAIRPGHGLWMAVRGVLIESSLQVAAHLSRAARRPDRRAHRRFQRVGQRWRCGGPRQREPRRGDRPRRRRPPGGPRRCSPRAWRIPLRPWLIHLA